MVEHTGDFYSCDHYVDSDNLLGNIKDHSLAYFLDCEQTESIRMSLNLSPCLDTAENVKSFQCATESVRRTGLLKVRMVNPD